MPTQKQNEEFHESCAISTDLASITCGCGKKVWYGADIAEHAKPRYCNDCREKVVNRILHRPKSQRSICEDV